MDMFARARQIDTSGFATTLGTQLEVAETDRVLLRMPYAEHLGLDRVHGGAIAALVDVAATAAFWAHPDLTSESKGATFDFTIHILRL